MMSIDLAQAHSRDLLDASAAAYAVRSSRAGSGQSSAHVKRRARAIATRLRAR